MNIKKPIWELTDNEEKDYKLTPEEVKTELYDEKGLPIFLQTKTLDHEN